MLRFPRPADEHEACFGQRYAQLLEWALRITGQDRAQAEDLVHDAFVYFVAGRPDLSAIDNLDGYLYTSLRNLHLANARRAARRKETMVPLLEFDLLEYDSLPRGLRAMRELRATQRREQIHHQLRETWRYAQVRKASSKTASVLILRFFHGYYPGEIAQVLRVSRDTVDQLLRLARKEARLFMADPESPPYAAAAGAAGQAWPSGGLIDAPDLALTLRDAALRSDPDGTCLDRREIGALYAAEPGTSVPTRVAAHLVSCGGCLDRVNRHLGLPALADRHPLDSLGYDRDPRPPRGGGFGGAGGSGGGKGRAGGGDGGRRRLDAARRRLTDILAHKPQELHIAVDGVILGGQQVTSSVSRQTLRVSAADMTFLEVFSEQEVRLLFLSVEPPPGGPVEARQRIDLSDGRRLDALVDFSGTNPIVRVSYVDGAQAEPATAAAVPLDPPAAIATPSRREARRRWSIRGWLSRLIGPAGRVDPSRWRLTRGGAFTALVAATTIAAVLLNHVGEPVLSAAELLRKSTAADAAWQTDVAHATFRIVDLEARSRTSGATVRRRVEIWQSAARGLTVRRAYDDRHRLIAGEWIDTRGTRTVHRATSGAAAPRDQQEPAVAGREAWRIAPSAEELTRLAGTLDRAIVRKQAGGMFLLIDNAAATAASSAPSAAPAIVSASLTVREDWHAVEQRVTTRTIDETTDFTWIERSWTMRSIETVPADAFGVDASLIARAGVPPAASPVAAPAVRRPATADLQIAALAALRRIDADLGGELQVRRGDARLSVTGVVASAQRRAQILSVLGDVARDPAARIRIATIDEVHARVRRDATAGAARGAASTPTFGLARIPVHDEVRAALIASGVAAAVADDEVARAADRIVRRAQVLRLHAWALRDLLAGIPAADAAALPEHARAQWRALIDEHARAFLDEAGALSALVRPILPDPSAESAAPAATPAPALSLTDLELARRARAFVDAAGVLDEVVQSAFMLPMNGTTSAAPAPGAFWRAVHQATAAASILDRAARPSSPSPSS